MSTRTSSTIFSGNRGPETGGYFFVFPRGTTFTRSFSVVRGWFSA
jgi:hypothetical protein